MLIELAVSWMGLVVVAHSALLCFCLFLRAYDLSFIA